MTDEKMQASIGVAVLVLNEFKNKILLGIRQGEFKEGWHGVPGGKTDLDESLEECARRELEEEAGIKAESLEYIGVVRDFQETYDFIHFGFVVTNYSGEIRTMEPEKCKGWDWYALDEIPEKTLPGHKALIQLYNSKAKGLVDLHK